MYLLSRDRVIPVYALILRSSGGILLGTNVRLGTGRSLSLCMELCEIPVWELLRYSYEIRSTICCRVPGLMAVFFSWASNVCRSRYTGISVMGRGSVLVGLDIDP